MGRKPGSSEAECVCPAGDTGSGPQLVLWAQGLEGRGRAQGRHIEDTHDWSLSLQAPPGAHL